MRNFTIKFSERMDESAAFFSLYAGLRMYKEYKDKQTKKVQISIPAAEAHCTLESLRVQFPAHYKAAELEYNTAILKQPAPVKKELVCPKCGGKNFTNYEANCNECDACGCVVGV